MSKVSSWSEYIKGTVRRTVNKGTYEVIARFAAGGSRFVDLVHGVIGVSKEAAELLDAVYKHLFYGREVDKENVLEECGDVLFYLALVLDAMDFTLGDVVSHNAAKLLARYPTVFEDNGAIGRDVSAELERARKAVAR